MQGNYGFTILQNSFGIILCIIFFFAFIFINENFNKEIRNFFYLIIGFIVALLISDSFQGYFESLSYPTIARQIFACISYTLRSCLLYLFASLFIRKSKKIYRFYLGIPVVINALIVFSSFFLEKVVFYYTETNQIVRGPLLASPFIVSLFYFAIVVFFGLKKFKTGEPGEFILLCVVSISSIVATLLELFLRFQGFICTSAIIGVIFYYLFFTTYSFSFDQLTGTYMRKKLYEMVNKNKGYYSLISIDMNDLKMINDNKGHAEGDKALVTCANIIRDTLPINADIFRMGGDEFVILYRTTDKNEVEL